MEEGSPLYRSHCDRDFVSMTAVTSVSREKHLAPLPPSQGALTSQGAKSSWLVPGTITDRLLQGTAWPPRSRLADPGLGTLCYLGPGALPTRPGVHQPHRTAPIHTWFLK